MIETDSSINESPKTSEPLENVEEKNSNRTTGFFKEKPNQNISALEYPRNGKQPGLIVIFNQYSFLREDKTREGSIHDVNQIIDTHARLGFTVYEKYIFHDQRTDQIKNILRDISENEANSDYNCLIIYFLSHGDEGNVIKTKDDKISVEDIWSPFSEEHCSCFSNKPKLFIFQACKGYDISSAEEVKGHLAPPQTYTKPLKPDMLLAFSTVEGSVSRRHTEEGSWYIQELCRMFSSYGRRDDVVSLLLRTNKCVANSFYCIENVDGKQIAAKQMPLFISTLTKKFYLTVSKDRHHTLEWKQRNEQLLSDLQNLVNTFNNTYEDLMMKIEES